MSDKSKTDPQEQARILSEALPHMQRYDEETIVIKYGGHAMGDEALARSFAKDIVLLEQTAINPIVVHGGGPQIEAMLKRAGVQSQFAGGLAHHRRRDAGNRRDGAGRLDQQADRRLHQRRRRQGHRPVRQGRQHGDRQEGDPPRGRSRLQHREGGRSRLRRRARQGRSHGAQHGARPRADPGAGAGVRRGRRRQLQRQRRHLCRRHRRRAQGQALPAAHRRAGRARQVARS